MGHDRRSAQGLTPSKFMKQLSREELAQFLIEKADQYAKYSFVQDDPIQIRRHAFLGKPKNHHRKKQRSDGPNGPFTG
jgi:hypothetical protein